MTRTHRIDYVVASKFTLTFFMLFLASVLCAQTRTVDVVGVVTDSVTSAPMAGVQVVVCDEEQHVLGSAVTTDKGGFTVPKVVEGSGYAHIILAGYRPFHSGRLLLERRLVNLGTIRMSQLERGLREVTVRANRSNRIVYRLDRQTIAGNASLTAEGGTAVDVLQATPSVRVSSEGDVSFRGSTGFKVYIDGQLATTEGTQALQQIPASNIADIEIMTTPSARYKSDGDAGVINIITKNGGAKKPQSDIVVNLAGSTLGTWSSDITLNYRHGKHRWWGGGTLQEIKSKSDFQQQKNTLLEGYSTESFADGTRFRTFGTYTGRLGWEFAPQKEHLLSVELQAGTTKNTRGGDMDYQETRTQNEVLVREGTYDSHDRYILEKNLWQIASNYTWHTNPRGDVLALQGRLRYDNYSKEYTESNLFDITTLERFEGTRGYEVEHHWDADASASYQLHYRPKGKLELGYQYTTYSESGDYNFTVWNHDVQQFEWQPEIYTPFFYRRQLHAVYGQLTEKMGNFNFDAGLRADYVLDDLDIEVKDASRHRKHFNLFPSAHLTYRFSSNSSLSGGYSARINRPGIWQLEPYITYEDYYTKKIGNPDVRSELIQAYELSFHQRLNSKANLDVTAFHRYRTDVLDLIRKADAPGVTLDSLVNTGNDYTWGLELQAQYQAARFWKLTLNGSLYHYQFDANYAGCVNNHNTSYTLALLQAFTLGSTTHLQFDANFIGPTVLTQGKEDAYYYFNIGVRQQFLQKRITVSLVGHDIFRTAVYDNRRSSVGLVSQTHVRPKYPSITLSASFAFSLKDGQAESKEQRIDNTLFEGKDF